MIICPKSSELIDCDKTSERILLPPPLGSSSTVQKEEQEHFPRTPVAVVKEED
jgi:hypothetical protein